MSLGTTSETSANRVLRNERRQEYLPPSVDTNGGVTLWQYVVSGKTVSWGSNCATLLCLQGSDTEGK